MVLQQTRIILYGYMMNRDTEFTLFDMSTWERREIFHYFYHIAPTGYSLTAELDITKLLDTLKTAGIKFYPAYIWLVTRNLKMYKEFKTALVNGQPGYYNSLTPLYAVFHDDDKTFSLMWTEYSEDFNEFYEAYLKDKKNYGDNHGILAKKDCLPPENSYTVSSVPWVKFNSFAVHSYENKPYFFPSVEAGEYHTKDGKTMLPLSLTCHHAATDGYHISLFLKGLQKDADSFGQYLKQKN